jgi:hypothetical protein
MQDLQAYKTSKSIMTVAKYNIADHIGESGSKSCSEIAKLENISAEHLCRVLKFLETSGYFYETAPCTFKNTRISLVLASNHVNRLKYFAEMNIGEFHAADTLEEIVKTRKPFVDDTFATFEQDTNKRVVFAKAIVVRSHYLASFS